MVAWWRLYQLNGQSWGCPDPEYLSHARVATPSASLASHCPTLMGRDTALGHIASIYNNNNMGQQQQKMLTLVMLLIFLALCNITHQIFKYNQLTDSPRISDKCAN